jgi:hypothetical protein
LNSRPQEKAQLQNCKKMDAWAWTLFFWVFNLIPIFILQNPTLKLQRHYAKSQQEQLFQCYKRGLRFWGGRFNRRSRCWDQRCNFLVLLKLYLGAVCANFTLCWMYQETFTVSFCVHLVLRIMSLHTNSVLFVVKLHGNKFWQLLLL